MSTVLSIVVPCYNEQDSIEPFLKTTCPILDNLASCDDWHIVLVNDGSSDETLSRMREAHNNDPHVAYISFSRNFGKEAGLLAGMEKSLELDATHVVVMDVDLQDPPSLLPQMLERLEATNCDIVATYRTTRAGEPPIRSWFARRFYELMGRFSDVEMRDGARDYRIMTRRVVEAIVGMPETQRFSKGLFAWVGYHTEWIGYENVERTTGETHWNFFSLFSYALDGIIAFSVAPLIFISLLGLTVFALAMVFLVFIFVRALLFGDPVAGWPSLVCIVTLLSGLQLLSMGVLGLYLSKVYSEVKRRPMYLVAEES
ncbi:MAG: glycosyltransferase family 2 protein [Atopobiaceae bacterium]|nr:glycosyltransferase family 2 protein [Atopobiaceae bacterium]